ncbi:hypothetical protein CSV71_00525 [Sporosarcina sp. P21c]|uniref:hypothetical protein n=1 Tax=Sporosarcina TaxID=1569 RepID=UPI000A15F713|nr:MULTISPECIES: hypothetical protein [Sporosarcina]ARJ40118.1 hypothetical protein SporoP8_15235 [Sporosarcina ureae]PIC68685.1 hypothetical protein CSV78_01055 [Sporosarcina sp. P16a]PIC84544.1 hypothetical protein CSV73_01215 [Sporosarcina sp. P1]PIC91131.1 hypothetical protein CSV71_00525 [Sporosarcina sp. P21c]PIC93737.1 hypothetical protein CSV70_04395 [Sporosarcina sp. P25]
MRFLYITYRKKQDIQKVPISENLLKRVHAAPIEHPIVYWLQKNVETIEILDSVIYYDLTKEMVESFYNTLWDAHAEKTKASPRPWKFLPIPADEQYIYPIAQYEKEYGVTYYESIYKYITVLGVILNIFDFDANQLIIFIQ